MNEFVSAVSLIDWPAIPSAQGAAVLALQYQLEQSQWWSEGQLRDAQREQLELLLRHAAQHVPLYRERFATAGFDARGAVSWEDFARLPPLRRTNLQERRNELISNRALPHHGQLTEGHSSGSTGRPVRFLKTQLVNLVEEAVLLRDHGWHKRDLMAKHVTIRASVEDRSYRGWGPGIEQVFWTGPSATLNIRSSIDAQAAWLRKQNPHYLLTHPSNARELALHCMARSIQLPRLKEVRTFGEVVHPDLPDLVREAWASTLIDVYSSEEAGAIALQCPQQQCYHVQSEKLIVEIVDETGRPASAGQAGRVLLTTLQNFAMPLIRYEIGDFAIPGALCGCGRGLPVIDRVMGRRRNLVTLPDGTRHWPYFSISTWAYSAPVRQMQIVQETVTHIEVRLVADRVLDQAEHERLVQSLQQSFGYAFDVTVTYVDAIERGANFKYEDFVSRLDAAT